MSGPNVIDIWRAFNKEWRDARLDDDWEFVGLFFENTHPEKLPCLVLRRKEGRK